MKRKWNVVLVLLLIAAMLLTACGGDKKEEAPAKEGGESADPGKQVVVGLVANGFGTQSFNDDVLHGLKTAEKELGIKGIPLEVIEISDSANSIRTLISQGAEVMIIPSSEYRDGMLEVAPEYPDVKFIYLPEPLDEQDNILSTSYRENEAAFMAGVLAGLMTKSNNVGAVMAVGEPLQYRFHYGFASGVKYVNAAAEVQAAYTNSYSDVGKGKEVANAMYTKGADFVATYAGACNLGVFAAAEEAGEGKYCFGAANGQFDKMPSKILASVVKPIDGVIVDILRGYVEKGEFNTSEVMSLGLKEKGVILMFTPEEDLLKIIPEDVMKKVEDIESKVINGEIDVPSNEEEYKKFNDSY